MKVEYQITNIYIYRGDSTMIRFKSRLAGKWSWRDPDVACVLGTKVTIDEVQKAVHCKLADQYEVTVGSLKSLIGQTFTHEFDTNP